MDIIYKGAEAVLYKDKYLDMPVIRKERKPKKYRIRELDDKIKKERIRKESRVMREAREHLKTPHVIQVNMDTYTITMEHIKGETLKERIIKGKEDPEEVGREVGESLNQLHNADIVHNDLTTSNMIRKNGEIYFIDFGLAEKTEKIEDKAMDLLVFKKMLKSTHWEEINDVWRGLKDSYINKETLKRLKKIEKRVRYSEK